MSPHAAAVRLLGTQLVVVEQRERLVGRRLVVAAVVGQPRDRGVRELLVPDPVPAPQLHRVQAEFDGQLVHDPLDGVRRLRAPGTAVGVGRRPGREDAGDVQLVGVHLVDARVHERAQDRDAGGDQHQVGAHVDQQVGLEAQESPVAGRGDLDVLDHAPAVVRRQVALRAGLGPLHRSPEAPRDREGDRLLAVHLEFGAEAAAHVGGDHPQPVLGDAGDDGKHDPEDVRDLGGGVHGVLVGGGDRGDDDRPRLHRVGDEPLLVVAAPERDLGAPPYRLEVLAGAQGPVVAAVGALVGVDQWGALGECGLQVQDRGQRGVVDLDRLQGVGGRVPVAGHDHGHRVTGVAHLVDGDRRMVGQHDVLGHRPGAGQRAQAVREVGAAERGDHTGPFECRGDVDAVHARVGHGAAQDRQVEQAGGVDVVGPAGLSGDEPGVLLAEPGGADLAHVVTPSSAAARTARTMFW